MILVTGAAGHIGNVLIRKLLAQGKKVRALILHGEDTTSIKDLEVEQIEGDVLDPTSLDFAMKNVETVYHLAGIISIMPGRDPFVWQVNVDGTRNVLEAACRAHIRRLVYTSSIHAIKRIPHGAMVDESLGFDPSNPYGEYDRSKAAASLEVQNAAKTNLDTVLVCPTGIIGPYDFRGSELGEVIRGAAFAKPMFYIEGAYDFVDVRDVVDGLIAANEKGQRGEAYILSGNRASVRDLIETVRQVTGKAFASIKVPFSLAEFATRYTVWYYQRTKSKPRFTPYSLEVLQSNSNISHAKASHELGYHPRPLLETIADTVHWFFENRHAKSTTRP